MRAAYTSAVIVKMLGLGWKFPHVSGISAGSSLTANYISREPPSPIKPSPLISSPSARQVRLSASARPVPATASRNGSLARI